MTQLMKIEEKCLVLKGNTIIDAILLLILLERSDFGENNRQHHKKLREEKLKSSARGDDQGKIT